MKLEPECIGCFFNQVLKAFKLLKPNISNDIILDAQERIMKFLLKNDIKKITSPLVGKYLYNLIGNILNDNDPYANLKKTSNQIALKYYDRIKNFIEKSADPLLEALVVSALGNTIDFASQHKIDILNDIEKMNPKDLIINDYIKFKQSLDSTDRLVILLDNAGEIVFDKILVEILQKFYPKLEIICAVRSAPIINDATMQDAEYIKLNLFVKIIKSSPAPGIDFSDISEELRKYLYSEDGMILSKGQGNFETLYGLDLPNKNIFYLLKAKCNLMERIFNVKIGSLILKKKTLGF
ncbi:MAG: DUF89 family protein [Candidatus Lokiarchaeota archaeon]|nr:DUF89 family protein [Candidatus Lokiarchaeota archaeon]